ncbi:hypothetical protein F5B20DRAFT_592594 [Whalleya microplaca]|nr:hypothetical protein F5B20DRAFT_592594 [Whalleya microplaca]
MSGQQDNVAGVSNTNNGDMLTSEISGISGEEKPTDNVVSTLTEQITSANDQNMTDQHNTMNASEKAHEHEASTNQQDNSANMDVEMTMGVDKNRMHDPLLDPIVGNIMALNNETCKQYETLVQRFHETQDEDLKDEIHRLIDNFSRQGKVILHFGYMFTKSATKMWKRWKLPAETTGVAPTNNHESTQGETIPPKTSKVDTFPPSNFIKVEALDKGISVRLLQKGHDGSRHRLSPAVEIDFLPGKMGAKDNTFVLDPSKRTVNILRKAYRLVYERKKYVFGAYAKFYDELQLGSYRQHYAEHDSQHFYASSAFKVKPTSNLLEVRMIRKGEYYAEKVDSMLFLARYLPNDQVEYREVVKNEVYERGALTEHDIILWEHETTLALLYDWATALAVLMKKKGQIHGRITAPATRQEDLDDEGIDDIDQEVQDVGTLLNRTTFNLSGHASKKRRQVSEEDIELE